MQTFLPFSSFQQSASVLDNKRLWKQILEADELSRLISNPKIKSNWRRHPAYKMWENNLDYLVFYRDIFVKEWLYRRLESPPQTISPSLLGKPYPHWLNNEQLHSSHRAALLAKNPEWYGKFGWRETPKIEYYWPIPKSKLRGKT